MREQRLGNILRQCFDQPKRVSLDQLGDDIIDSGIADHVTEIVRRGSAREIALELNIHDEPSADAAFFLAHAVMPKETCAG